MFVFYDWPFPHMCTLHRMYPSSIFNSWLNFSNCVVFYGDIIFILSKIKNLNFTSGANGPTCITVQNLIKISQKVADMVIERFS